MVYKVKETGEGEKTPIIFPGTQFNHLQVIEIIIKLHCLF